MARRWQPFGVVTICDSRLLPIYDLLLSRHVPSALLIDDDHQLVHAFGGAEEALVESALREAIHGAIVRARRDGSPVCYTGLRARLRGALRAIQLEIEPVVTTAGEPPDYLVVLREAGDATVPQVETRLEELEAENAELRSIVEELRGRRNRARA